MRGAEGARYQAHRLRGADAGVLACLLLAGVVLPVFMAVSLHSLAIPHNDDWAYRRVLTELARSGQYRLVGWGSMTLVGQILLTAPVLLALNFDATAPALAVALSAAVGLVAVYMLARSFIPRVYAGASAFLVLTLPGFLATTTSFMTDVPAFTAETCCLALGVAALQRSGRRHWLFLVASLVVGVFGFSIREPCVAAPIAVLAVVAFQRRGDLASYVLAGVCVALSCAAIYLWTSQLPGAQHKAFGAPAAGSAWVLLGAYFSLAFFVSPVLPSALRRSSSSRSVIAFAVAALALAAGLLMVARHKNLLLGNYVTQKGATAAEVLAGGRPNLFPGVVWASVQVVALGAGATLAFVVARNALSTPRHCSVPQRRVITWFTWLSASGLFMYALFVRAALWDRYIWPVAFGTALLLLSRPARAKMTTARPRPRLWKLAILTGALAASLSLVALAVTTNVDAYDAARWQAGEDALKLGYRATSVDAGFEWVGSHASSDALPGRRVGGSPSFETWYDQMFPLFVECALVSGSNLAAPKLRLLRTLGYNELGFAVPEHLYLYAVATPGCRGPASTGNGR